MKKLNFYKFKKVKFLSIILIIALTFIFSGCSNKKNQSTTAQTMEYAVAYELSKLENIENLDNETLKALTVVIRTNLSRNPKNAPQNINKDSINEKYINISNETKNQILSEDKKTPAEVSYKYNSEEGSWGKEIKKSEILGYMLKNKISLSNISNVEQIVNEDNELEYLIIGGKKIPFIELKDKFNLKSNKITSVLNKNTTILIQGEYDNNKNYFDFSKINQNNSQNYKDLLKNRYNNYSLITLN